ncbi:MAG: hypothetical protein R2941_14385 [Desulfobacterales bacterium]
MELEKLDTFVNALKTEYEKKENWDSIAENPVIFMETFRITMLGKDFPKDFPGGPHFDPRHRPTPGENPGWKKPNWERPGPPEPMKPGFGPPPPRERFEEKMPGPGDRHFEEFHDPALKNLMRLRMRLNLFDAQKKAVFEKQASAEKHTLREIVSKGKTVGWLGLRKEENLSNPLDAQFLGHQEKLFYLMGGIILIPVIFVSFFLARHHGSIRELARNTESDLFLL